MKYISMQNAQSELWAQKTPTELRICAWGWSTVDTELQFWDGAD